MYGLPLIPVVQSLAVDAKQTSRDFVMTNFAPLQLLELRLNGGQNECQININFLEHVEYFLNEWPCRDYQRSSQKARSPKACWVEQSWGQAIPCSSTLPQRLSIRSLGQRTAKGTLDPWYGLALRALDQDLGPCPKRHGGQNSFEMPFQCPSQKVLTENMRDSILPSRPIRNPF